MSNINLQQFVDINIRSSALTQIKGTRDIVAILTTDVVSEVKVYSSYNDVIDDYVDNASILALSSVYFANGGAKLTIIHCDAFTKSEIAKLPDEYICIAFAKGVAQNSKTTNEFAKDIYQLATDFINDKTYYGIKEKLFITRIENKDETTIIDETLSVSIKNLAIKYSSEIGAEMTMAAYLSKIDVYKRNSVIDYAFTQEILAAENIDNETFSTMMSYNWNVNIELANAKRVCGGNCSDGTELTNAFVRIVLHQTLTNRLVQLLTQKLTLSTASSKIYATITQELAYYLSAGYLSTDKIWSEETLYATYNNQQYVIVDKGTALTNGYIVKVLPYSGLTAIDRQRHIAPPIYIIIADQYAIRKIVIEGDVI